MSVTVRSRHRCFDGEMVFCAHSSEEIGGEMRFALFLPPGAGEGRRAPLLTYLAGLTCTEETFPTKGGALAEAARAGIALLAPDTSPRDRRHAGDDESWDFGLGAGFYVDATELPWRYGYRMHSYVTAELPGVVASEFPVEPERAGIFGHSMGGHGALVAALRNPGRYRSVSAFAPIAAPSHCPWGHKALGSYLGADPKAWRAWDATALVEDGARCPPLLVDQGLADKFLADGQLLPERLEAACAAAGQPLELRRQDGYDHGYYFISTFMADHIRHHAAALGS